MSTCDMNWERVEAVVVAVEEGLRLTKEVNPADREAVVQEGLPLQVGLMYGL